MGFDTEFHWCWRCGWKGEREPDYGYCPACMGRTRKGNPDHYPGKLLVLSDGQEVHLSPHDIGGERVAYYRADVVALLHTAVETALKHLTGEAERFSEREPKAVVDRLRRALDHRRDVAGWEYEAEYE